MRSVEQMREAINGLMKQLGDMKAKCMGEGREYDDEEKKLIRSIQARIDDLREQIELEEKTASLDKDLSKSRKEPPKADPNDDGTRSLPYGEGARTRGPQFQSLGEQLVAIAIAGQDGGHVDPRLIEERATGLSEGIASGGGFLLQDNFAAQMIETVWEDPDLLGRVNKISITKGNNMKIPAINETSRADGSRSGGVQMYWAAEAGSKIPSKPDYRQIELVLKKLIGLIYATDELLEDAPALESYIRRAFAAEMRFKLIDALIRGTGAGQPLGILASPCLVTVAAETGQPTATIVYENLAKMYSRMIATSRQNAVWHINQDLEPQLYDLGITVGLGGSPIFMPAGGISGKPYNTLWGLPIVPLEQCATLGTLGDIFFCDWTKYIAIDKGAMQSAVSIHVKFTYDESVFRFVYRFDGQPELASAITPYSASANTLSHFITLAARP